jgi:hypothetical protein
VRADKHRRPPGLVSRLSTLYRVAPWVDERAAAVHVVSSDPETDVAVAPLVLETFKAKAAAAQRVIAATPVIVPATRSSTYWSLSRPVSGESSSTRSTILRL